jgi:hypothetical protein
VSSFALDLDGEPEMAWTSGVNSNAAALQLRIDPGGLVDLVDRTRDM